MAVDFYIRFQPEKIKIETIAGQAALVEPIQRTAEERIGHELPLDEITQQKKKKELRIYGMEHYFKSGRFYVQQGGATRFRAEYSSFPVGQMRDLLDAIAFQVEEWEKHFRRISQSKGGRGRQQRAADQRRQDNFRKHMSKLRGRRRRG